VAYELKIILHVLHIKIPLSPHTEQRALQLEKKSNKFGKEIKAFIHGITLNMQIYTVCENGEIFMLYLAIYYINLLAPALFF